MAIIGLSLPHYLACAGASAPLQIGHIRLPAPRSSILHCPALIGLSLPYYALSQKGTLPCGKMPRLSAFIGIYIVSFVKILLYSRHKPSEKLCSIQIGHITQHIINRAYKTDENYACNTYPHSETLTACTAEGTDDRLFS